MATTNNKSKNLVDLMIDAQSNIVDQAIETTKKLTKEIPFVNETLDKGHKLYKDSVRAQSDLIDQTAKTINETATEMNQSTESAKNFFEQWFENQTNWAKTFFDATKNGNAAFSTNPNEWMNTWQNMAQQNSQYWMNTMNGNPFSNMMKQQPLFNMQNRMNDGMQQWSHYTKQYFDMMNNGYGDWWKQFPNMTAADSFKGMNQMADNLSKFYELWIPMFKSIQDKSFDMKVFRDLLQPEKYKEFMDKFFHFMPDDAKKMMDQMNQTFVQNMKQMSELGLNNFGTIRNQMHNNPWIQSNPFNQMMDMYMNWKNAMAEAVSPLSKLVEENSNVKNAKAWNEIFDRMAQYNIKNNELQYMIYQHGYKVMEQVAENLAKKIQNGESIESIIKVYQDWLMTGDQIFTNLFQSDEYSRLMTEVSSLQMKVKQEVDNQMEKMFFVNLPVATRSEMDEVYKNLYDLKKMVRQMEKMMTGESTESNKTNSKKK